MKDSTSREIRDIFGRYYLMLHDDYGVTVPTLTGMKDANRKSKETTMAIKQK